MGFFWTTALEAAVEDQRLQVADGPVNVTVHLLSHAPELTEDIPAAYQSVGAYADLIALAGWEEVTDPSYTAQTISCTIVNDGNNFYLHPSTALTTFSLDARTQVEGIAYTMSSGTLTGSGSVDTLVAVTTSPFPKKVVFDDGDGIYALSDTTAGTTWFFGWAVGSIATYTFATAAEGPVALRQGAPAFESTRLQHVWMRPQRVNYIANPSFERTGGFWQSNMGPLTRVTTDVGGTSSYAGTATFYTPPVESVVGQVYAGVATASAEALSVRTNQLTAPGPSTALLEATATAYNASVLTSTEVLPQYAPDNRLYVQSAAFFPIGPNLTFQVKARGTGIARVGIAYYSRDYTEHTADWGLRDDLFYEEWTLSQEHDIDMQGIRTLTDRAYEAALLIEVRGYMENPDDPDNWVWIGPELTIDQVLVEEGTLLGWPYFDGDSTYGAEGDFSWYGPDGSDKVGKSYSLWYNDQKAIAGRLFSRRVDDTALYTSYDEQLDSMLTEWVPTGTTLVPHWGVLGPYDTMELPKDRSATTLPLEVWPEQNQPFDIYEVVSFSETATTSSVVLLLTGEGGHPITRGYIRTLPQGTVTPVTISTRPWQEVGVPQYEVNAMLAELYDLSTAVEVTLTWDKVPSFATNVLYLERGDSYSPQSYLTYDLISAASAGISTATAEALNAVVDVAASAQAVAATGTANAATTQVGSVADTAAATAEAQLGGAGATTEGQVSTAAATGTAFDGTAINGIITNTEAIAATGAANDASTAGTTTAEASAATGEAFSLAVTVSPAAEQAAATGAAQDAGTNIVFGAEAIAASGTSNDAANSLDTGAEAAAATSVSYNASVPDISIGGATTGLASGAANNGSTDIVGIPQSLSTSGITTSAITLNWAAPATFTSPDPAGRYEVFRNGVSQGTTNSLTYTFSGLAGNTSYTLGVRAVATSGAVSSLATTSASTLNPDTTAPANPTLVSFKPETSYGRMVFRWTYPADTDLNTLTIQRSTNGTNWTTDGSVINCAGLQGTAGSRVLNGGTAYTSGQTVYVRTIITDTNGNSRTSGTLSTYTLIDEVVFVAATGTSSWRNTNGGEWNAANDSRAYQGYFSNPDWNYRGFYFYSNGISAYYNSGRRTCTQMRQLLIRHTATGSSAGHTPVMALHKTVSRPADATGVASPSLFGSQTSTGLSLGFGASAYWTLPTAWRDGLFDGTYEGLLHYDSTSPVYAAYASTSDNGFTGLIEITTLG